MADPRATLLHVGDADGRYETFTADGVTITYSATTTGGSASVGLAVSLVGGVLETAADGEAIIGKLEKVEKDLTCRVQIGGMMTLPGGTGATLTQGARIVGDLLVAAEGYIQAAAAGTAAHHVVSRGFIVDASDTAAVVVYLG